MYVCYMKATVRKEKPKFEEEQLGDNLFASIDKLKVEVTISSDVKIVNNEERWVERSFEKDPYCKVFATSDRRLAVQGLKSYAKDLLMWIIYELDPAKDYFWLNRQRYMKEAGIKSPTTVSLAVRELNNKFILATNVREIYFVNPHFFFNGSRMNKFPENVVKQKKEKK